jgi:hypothetical protein
MLTTKDQRVAYLLCQTNMAFRLYLVPFIKAARAMTRAGWSRAICEMLLAMIDIKVTPHGRFLEMVGYQ